MSPARGVSHSAVRLLGLFKLQLRQSPYLPNWVELMSPTALRWLLADASWIGRVSLFYKKVFLCTL